MDLNYDILQYYAYKKIIKRRQMKGIYEDCTRLQMPVGTVRRQRYEETAKNGCCRVVEPESDAGTARLIQENFPQAHDSPP